LRRLPDLFELRLDVINNDLDEVQRRIGKLAAPLIITARDPAEGGRNALKHRQRAALLMRFLPMPAYVELELRPLPHMSMVLKEARQLQVGVILSAHDFDETPSGSRLEQLARAAENHRADIFKVATRTDTRAQLARLVDFFDQSRRIVPISAMGIGKHGRAARIAFLRRGSALNYAHLSNAAVAGQFSLVELRRQMRLAIAASV